MAFIRAELRAFPRFAAGVLAQFHVAGCADDGQVMDVSRGGCKLLPFRLEPLVLLEPPHQSPLLLIIQSMEITARLAWSTPNYSALGCQFDQILTDDQLQTITAGQRAL